MILSKDQNEICQWLLFDMSQGILGFFSDFFPNNIRRFWNPCLWGVAMWCWPVSRYSKISDSCTIPMNMSLASALRLSGFWYFKMQLNFRRKWEKNLPSCSSYYIFFFVFLSYFWFMIFFDVMVTSRNVLLYFLLF